LDNRLLSARRITAENTLLTLNASVGRDFALSISASLKIFASPEGYDEGLAFFRAGWQ
jgi:hypothetical protein